MAKMYYNLEETLQKLGCNEDQLKGMVRAGKLREFRDAGKLNYKVEDVDRVVEEQASLGGSSQAGGSGTGLSLEDSGEISLMADDSGGGLKLDDSTAAPAAKAPAKPAADKPSKPGPGGSDAPVDLSGSSGAMKLEDSGEIRLSDSGSGELKLEDTGGGDLKLEDSRPGKDQISLDEVDKDQLAGMKKDDTVITNIGISVFDDEDLEIAADPMAKTMLTSGGDEHLGLDGSAGGSGLLDLTRESDDTSLGAELLEGIDMGDTAETIAPTQTAEAVEPSQMEVGGGMPEPSLEPVMLGPRSAAVHYVEAASPAFTGLLAAAAVALTVLGGTVVATTMGAWPSYLRMMADSFWMTLGGFVGLGALCAGIGFVTTMKSSGPKAPKAPKAPKKPKEAKPKKEKGK